MISIKWAILVTKRMCVIIFESNNETAICLVIPQNKTSLHPSPVTGIQITTVLLKKFQSNLRILCHDHYLFTFFSPVIFTKKKVRNDATKPESGLTYQQF